MAEKMSADERNYPPRQPYLAFVYGVGKRADDLERTVTAAQRVRYLPEEDYLFTRAREELNRKPAKSKPAKAANSSSGTGP